MEGVSQEQVCVDSCMCCLDETEVADQTGYLIQLWCTGIRRSSLSTGPMILSVFQGRISVLFHHLYDSTWEPFLGFLLLRRHPYNCTVMYLLFECPVIKSVISVIGLMFKYPVVPVCEMCY